MKSISLVPFSTPDQWLPSELDAWSMAIRPGDMLYRGGVASEWSESTLNRSMRYYGSLVHFYDRVSGLPPADSVSDRITKEAIGGYVQFRQASVSDNSLAVELRRIAAVVKLLDPVADRSVLNRVSYRLERRHRRRSRPDVTLVDPPSCVRRALQIMEVAEESWNGPTGLSAQDIAYRYASALLVAFWAMCPLRPANIAQMRRSVHFEGWGRSARLRFSEKEMKGRRPFSAPIPPILVDEFEDYWSLYRAALVSSSQSHDYIWVDRAGRPLSSQGASAIVGGFTEDHFGVRMTGHKLRHAAASFISDRLPARAGCAAGVLGHSDFSTTKEFYIKGQQHSASRLYSQCVDDVVRSGRSSNNGDSDSK